MSFDLDRYYTPEAVARSALERADLPNLPIVCADSTCGTGRLLEAANDVFGLVKCVGIDRDKQAIANLRRRNPSWALAVGDLLNKRHYKKTFSAIIPKQVDLLVLNPPFSQGQKKSVDVIYGPKQFKATIAMAHLLKSFELFNPSHGAVAIVPESLLYSETDAIARAALMEKYCFRQIAELASCTFRGARARASVVQISSVEDQIIQNGSRVLGKKVSVSLIRGGLPVHVMKEASRGVPYVHTTDIRNVVNGATRSCFHRTADIAKGRIAGWAILIPRVGMPEPGLVTALRFENPVQLSDCVIALSCCSKTVAVEVEERIRASWDDFRSIYRGTGARYLTLSRLRTWLAARNIHD